MEIRRFRAFTGVVSVALAGTVVLAGCSSGGDGDEVKPSAAATSATTAAGGVAAATPGAKAKAYPVPAEVQPEQLPSLGTRENAHWELTLNSVRRVNDESVLVTGTLIAKTTSFFTALAEPGYAHRKDAEGGNEQAHEFSAVNLTVPGNTSTVYQVMRTEAGVCACTQGIGVVQPEDSIGVFAYLTAPKDATKVTITVRGFTPFTDVEVTS